MIIDQMQPGQTWEMTCRTEDGKPTTLSFTVLDKDWYSRPNRPGFVFEGVKCQLPDGREVTFSFMFVEGAKKVKDFVEAYKSTCPDCQEIYFWVGYKTKIGKTADEILQMDKDQHVCRCCGSTKLKTELDRESPAGKAMEQEQKRFTKSVQDHM